jgi:hypothetical protein
MKQLCDGKSSTELLVCLAAGPQENPHRGLRREREREEVPMAEAALCLVWGAPIPGRERQALNAFNEALQYWAGLQLEGEIERFDVTVLAPTGGQVAGFLVVRGTAEQIDSLRRSKEYLQQVARVQLVASQLSVADAYVDEGLVQIVDQYQEVIVQAE